MGTEKQFESSGRDRNSTMNTLILGLPFILPRRTMISNKTCRCRLWKAGAGTHQGKEKKTKVIGFVTSRRGKEEVTVPWG
jgi:hypothetical protein